MSDLSDLYQEVILDHNRRPRNYGVLAGPSRKSLGHNPLCGDRVTLYVRVEGDLIADVSFEGSGCAISKASASLMTDAVKGRTIDYALGLFDRFHHMVTLPMNETPDEEPLGKLAAFSGVRQFPVRIKCASLPWHTLKAALAAAEDIVHTE